MSTRADTEALQSSVLRVLAVHRPMYAGYAICQHCAGPEGSHEEYPCATVRAVIGEGIEDPMVALLIEHILKEMAP